MRWWRLEPYAEDCQFDMHQACQMVASEMKTDREQYIQKIVGLALFFRDMYEESNAGQTTAIRLLKHRPDISNVAVRKYLLDELYRNRQLTLTEAAMQIAIWHPDGHIEPSYALSDIEGELRKLCSGYERPIQMLTDDQHHLIPERAYARAARYLQKIHTHGFPAHSRVIEIFIHDSFFPHGRSRNGGGHREHVVPCVLIRDEAVNMFCHGASIDAVIKFLQKNTVIVEISISEQKRLDSSEKNGGLGLKTRMPPGWDFATGCIFGRLHSAGIDFDPPPGFSQCCHRIS